MMSRPADEVALDTRLRTMRILWAAQLLTVGLFFVVTRVTRPDVDAPGAAERNNPPLLYALAAAGLSAVVVSFVLKGIFYRRAAERQQPAQVQTGLVLALALCETAVLMGLVGFFITLSDYAYLLFVLGALGMALHFPRREQVQAAHYKSVG
ncbi:MAG TPA: hypothetical protein VF611_09550 [Pyrinomonadaceae bacterium]|jgi:F0F1-type ATP synthase membrane subunit c/vacuolar-type H+-ATPase subunit K